MLRVMTALLLVASPVAAQPASTPPPPAEPRWLAHVTMHHGIAVASDSVDDNGASSPGVALGLQAGVQWRFASNLSLGVGFDVTFSSHESEYSAAAEAKYTHYFFPVLVGRFDLGRFAVTGWGGYERGSRAITEPGGLLGADSTVSRDSMNGIVAAGAFVVRFGMPTPYPLTAEFGPFVQTALFSAGDGSVTTVVFGLCAQAVFQGPAI